MNERKNVLLRKKDTVILSQSVGWGHWDPCALERVEVVG